MSHIKPTPEGQVASSWTGPVPVSWPHRLVWWCHKSCWGQCPRHLQAGWGEAASAPMGLGWTRVRETSWVNCTQFTFSWKRSQSTWKDQLCGWETHLSKTSRLRASFVLVGVLRVFWRNSTFFFRLCGQRYMQELKPWISLISKVKIISDGFALQKSLYQHWIDRSAGTSCPFWSESAPLRPCVTKMSQKSLI